MELTTDVVVLGAGAAGLAAARVLANGGAAVIAIEARERVGGRLLTREDAGVAVPLELGGEFIHGTAPVSFALLRAAGTVAIDTAEGSFVFEHGDLREGDDAFAIAERALARCSTLHDDISIAAFTRDLDERERVAMRALVEGFDAADPARASTCALAQEWNGAAGGQTSYQFRPLGGYARLMRALHEALDPERARVLLATPAHAVRRFPGGVAVDATTPAGAALTVRARAAIVTVPVGVLQTDALRFDPPLPQATRDALASLIMGPVVKLALRFRNAFWETLRDGRYRDAAFFRRVEATFPTFWTMLPLRAPVLVAWAGGPKADALAGLDERARVEAALDDLRVLFGGEVDAHPELEAAYTHDWQRDPYARGAYSYVAVGGAAARAGLASPVDGALFFAGEATAPASEAGTVAGALLTGERAAREALAFLAIGP